MTDAWPPEGTFEERLGMQIERRDGTMVTSLVVRPDHCNPSGFPHGAVAFALADTAIGGTFVDRVKPLGKYAATVEMSARFLRPPKVGDRLTASVKVLHQGETLAAAECDVVDQDGRLIVKAMATFALKSK